MVEKYTFNLYSKYASAILGAELQRERLREDMVKIAGVVGDNQYFKVQALDSKLGKSNKHAFMGWSIQRTFSQKEIDHADLFLILLRYKHAAGEEFGTWYTDEQLNPDCGLERKSIKILQTSPFRTTLESTRDLKCSLSSRRVGPLQIPHSELMKSHDIFSLWGGEFVTSGRLAAIIESAGFFGGKLLEISNTKRGSRSLRDLSDVPSGLALKRQAELKGLKVSDREYWQWLEEPSQLPLLERALWEQQAVRKAKRAAK